MLDSVYGPYTSYTLSKIPLVSWTEQLKYQITHPPIQKSTWIFQGKSKSAWDEEVVWCLFVFNAKKY